MLYHTIFFFLFPSIVWSAYFDDQPKLLTENGNFVIESAFDKNISFRLKGSSYVNINDVNVMTLFNGSTQQLPSSSLAIRLSTLEEQFRQLPSLGGESSSQRNRNIWQRVNALEQRVGNPNSNITWSGLSRRIRRLEGKMNRLMTRLNADNCSSNPCQNGGTCLNTFGSYICRCSDAWTGVNCEEDVNECDIFADTDLGCQNSISCENSRGGYTCRCKPGWLGIHCTKRTVDCSESSAYEMCGHGVCVHTNDASSYRCICDQGWTSNGTSPACTVDVNECDSAVPHCSRDPEVPCVNLPGSYACGQCPHGYTGNGHYCRDIDECETNNGGCSLSPFVQCINARGSSRCGPCPFGYTGNGRFCVRTMDQPVLPPIPMGPRYSQNQCESPNICHPLATCVQNLYAVTCICPAHYSGNGIGPFGCNPSNSTLDGCSVSPCLNEGVCISVGTFGYRCECPPGTTPPRCARTINVCSPNPCRNGGTCQVNRLQYRCSCPPGRTGRNCQYEARTCGGVLNSFNGTLKYPVQDSYPHNSRCAWLIKTNEDKVLNVTFTKFHLEHSRECRFDWLQIHDGRSSASYMIGRFCGNELPKNGNIISTQNMLYLWFRSDNSTSHGGFEMTWNSIDPVCGGDITITSHGTISSPGSPGNYPPNRDCIWKLSAPPSKRIQLHFFTLEIEAHQDCRYDYLAIYNGPSTNGDLLEKFCNTTHPEPLISPANELTLQFHSDEDGSDNGFQIHYSLIEAVQGCGGTFTATKDEFGSPIQNGQYPKNMECHYLIKMPRKNETGIKITFLSFNLESSTNCNFDYVEIYEGNNERAPKVGRWCGSRIPPEYSSQSGELLVVFRSDFSFGGDGFRLKYETLCGGRYDDENGVITSPWFPSPYEDNKNCPYDIEAPLDKKIVLNFTDFDIENDCDFDSLSIYDGVDKNDTLIGTYCGNRKPPVAISTLNHMHLNFLTDSSNTGPGFRAEYSFINAGCGGIIKKLNMTISPPTSDSGYTHEANCKWIIVAPPGSLVQLTFNSFHLESSSTCSYDFVTVYDNILVNETDAAPIGTYCGTEKPPIILSSSRAVTIVFKSDESVNGQGFSATYDFIDGRNLCGGSFHALSGTITSPNYPDRYPSSKNCIYVIHAPNGKQIQLRVEAFELEESNGCGFDALEIRNGANDKSPLMGTFCGTEILPRFKSFSNRIYLRFKTDSSNEYKGFKISYDTSSSGCGGIFTNAQSGTLTSPNYPEPYPANMQCDYTVLVARGSTVQLVLTDINMELSSDCSYDYISVYDGPNSAAKLIGTYCNSEQIIQMESTSHVVFIRLVTDVNNQGRGFEMRFSANCKRQIHDLRGAIESPNFPANYPHYAKCEWKIVPPLGNRVFLEFSHFDLEHSWSIDDEGGRSNSCIFDFLIIEEHDTTDTIVRTDKYCQTMPKPLNTSYTVVLKFESDFSNTAGGFHLEYEIQGCGGILNKPEGSFASPNYPKPYPHDTHCQWIIEVEYGNLVEITFLDYDFEATVDCAQDGLVIANDANATKVISKFCGSKHNQHGVVTSLENKVYVNFYSDLSYAGRGFSATYKTIVAKCGGTFSLAEGNITSPNYPMNYEANTYCQWLIRAEPSHSVQFKFTDFDLEDDCSADSVQIYDGPEKRRDKLLLQTCGSQTIESTNQTRLGFNVPVKSRGNEMLIVMEADHGLEAKGFAAQYSTLCGSRIVTSSSGMLEIGNNLRWITEECEWTITASNPNQHVSLTIMHIDNEPIIQKFVARLQNQTEAECTRTIFIYDGSSTRSPKISEICSSKHPPTVVSEGNALTISLGKTVENDFAFTFDLRAYYTVIDNECGGEFTSVSGQIASPGYPKTYKNNIECEWTLKASPGNQLSVSINMLDIDESEHCNDDYLEIRETNSIGQLIGVYCGGNIPTALPQVNTYWLKFRSDNDGVGRGFLLEYNHAHIVEQSGTNGVITSLMYPSYIYYTSSPYRWRITVKSGFLVRIRIDNCILKRDSTIRIYDGYDSSSATLSDIGTDNIPTETILSSTNVVLVEFEISTFSESKFKLIWNEVSSSEQDIGQNVTNSLNCSRNSVMVVHETDSLQLNSPGYPYGYDTNLNCIWTFLPAKMGYHVDISFTFIDLEVTPDCMADFVRVGTGSDMQNFEQQAPMCSMSQIVRRGRVHGAPNLRVQFQSDFSNNRTGFDSVVMLDCGGLLEGSHGEITHEMTVSNRTQNGMNETCYWTVTVNRGRTIQFAFEKLNLAKNDDGSCNSFIIIRNGIHDDSPFLGEGKFCSGNPTIPPSSSNKAIVQFVRNRLLHRTNDFSLKFEQIEHECGGTYTLDYATNSITVTSPNYPNIPSPHIECVWRITAPNGELLKVEFLDRFDLTPSQTCSTEYLEIREGSTSTAPLIGKYCHEKPHPIFSETNMIRLRYFTDVAIPRNGFKLKISFARCGKSIVANSGYISSPGFPGKGAYPTQATCDYHITGRIGTSVNITFLSLDLPAASNCSEVDHIEIFSMIRGPVGNNSYSEVRKVCGDTIPDSILTYSSNALIRFIVKSSNNLYSGFRLKFQSSIDTCGSRIEASTGIIQSPGYPVSPDATKYCEWLITVPKGRRVKVEILDFDVKPSGTLNLNTAYSVIYLSSDQTRITFYNDLYMASQIFSLSSTLTDLSRPIYSSDNTMGISALIRRTNVGYRGFKLRFTSNELTICNGNLNENSGTIYSPENVTRFYCEFTRDSHSPFIRSQPNVGTLAIKIFEESINTNRTQCMSNLPTGVSVAFINNERRTYYTKCPPKYENIASPYPSTKLLLRSALFKKYHFQYKIHNCGGILTEGMTRIVVPTLASNYGELDCTWQYTTNSDRNIQMIINAPSMNCETEYLNVYRGKTSNRPRVARICGDSQITNRTEVINGQNVYIEYHTDSYSQTRAQFQIDIITSDGVCGGILEPPNYIFSSPKNGSKYPANTECEWIIKARSGYHIGLTFINRLLLEQSPTCQKDYLKVFNKVDGEYREISKICGRDFPHHLNSTGQEMKVVFHTDGDGDGDGFTGAWAENCGGTFKATSKAQYITSPHFPDPYPKNAFCNYSIVGNEGESVSVKFLNFDLEASNSLCRFDNVTIYKYSMYGWGQVDEVGTFCMNGSVSTFRYTQRIDIVFRTDSFIERSGFKFVYSTDQCGGNITQPTQISSLRDDGDDVYLPLTTCVWFITAPSDKKILIRFEQFDLEHMIGCHVDYVEVFEGLRTNEKQRKARLCGNLTEHAPSISIDSNTATIKFATDATMQEKGFSALIMFTKNCNEYINLTSNNPRFNLNKLTDHYEPLLNCEYFVNAPKGYVIQVKFRQMHLHPCTTTAVNGSCTCDYLNIRDGSGPFAESFGSFCGDSNPPDIQTTTGDLYMRFVTDNISSGTGFSVDIEMIESPCGRGTYYLNSTLSNVTIQSPMNGINYMPNANCLWTFSTDDGKLVDISFEKFDLEEDSNNKCTSDFLEISDEETKTIITEGLGENTVFSGSKTAKNQYFYWGKQWPTAAHRYCGSGNPIDYMSSFKTVYVHFKSNEAIERTGFKFTAKIFSECQRNYTALQGRLFGKSLSDCEQYIRVPENYTITLYFASMDFRINEECTEDTKALKVYNANNNELLESYCGGGVPKPLFTTTNSLRLKFKNVTLSYYSSDIYDITYLACDKGRGCGGELYNYGGTFASPGYPNTDRNNSDCTWTINVPMNLFVAIQFQVFDMGPMATCNLNYVEIIENDEEIAPTRFCGTDDPAPYKAKTNRLKVHFKSSMNFAGTGWIVNFMAVHENSVINRF